MDNADYYLLDVFTDYAFAGNPLAVFPYADDLSAERMQAIANELNLSEMVFVGATMDPHRYPVRIFTPTMELPFAGHPTVGTAHLLAELGWVKRDRGLILEAGVGPLGVCFNEGLAYFTTAQPLEIGGSALDRAAAASLLGLNETQIVGEPILASCGVPYHLIELDSVEALDSVIPAPAHWARWVAPSGHDAIYLYVKGPPGEQANHLRCRMFTMGASLYEDPATGSAAAALVGTLAMAEKGSGRWQWQIDQGIEMGRPSRIIAEVEQDGDVMTIHIGGQAVIVGHGTMQIR
ncbi:PhzF family phenazine biosynthesis protein [Halomonas sp. GXIMD04776]|uniref:PhzF family phenazine biosynthesis protein n=1 Tax=Halomonas sp. GXIMD04776 TaxID=3415605 RepID=UPI003C878600